MSQFLSYAFSAVSGPCESFGKAVIILFLVKMISGDDGHTVTSSNSQRQGSDVDVAHVTVLSLCTQNTHPLGTSLIDVGRF